jgi:hypothetical protein
MASETVGTEETGFVEENPQPEIFSEWDTFLAEHGHKTDRLLLLEILWRQTKLEKGLVDVKDLIERIESEANNAMASLTDPSTMMKAAQNFLGG